MIFRKIYVQKNNKIIFPRNYHVGKIYLEEENWYLVRVEAESYRKEHCGSNYWDLFYLIYEEDEKNITYFLDTLPNMKNNGKGVTIASWGGWKTVLYLSKKIETPLGIEYIDLDFQIDWVPCTTLTKDEIQIINEVLESALREGFGPHGEIVSRPLPLEPEVEKEVNG